MSSNLNEYKFKNTKLIFWICFIFSFVQVAFDFLLLPVFFIDLLIVKAVCLALISFTFFLLAHKKINSSIIIHLCMLVIMVSQLFCISFLDEFGKSVYLVYLTVFFCTFNIIVLWSFWAAFIQFILICFLYFLFDFYQDLDFLKLVDNGLYVSLGLMAISTTYPSIKANLIKDNFNQGVSNEQENARLKSELRTLEKSIIEKDKFINSINNRLKVIRHDLKNKLNNILSLSDLIEHEKQYVVKEDQDDYLNLIKLSIDELSLLSGQLLEPFDSSFLEKNLNFNFQKIELDILLEKNLVKLKELIIAKNISINIERTSEDTSLFTDPKFLNISIFNILKYAINFSSNNDTLNLIFKNDEGLIQLLFVNNTTGLHIAKLESFFKSIDQFDINEISEKKGLGLSIAKYYIEELGGHVLYSSSTSLGFEFSIEFSTNK